MSSNSGSRAPQPRSVYLRRRALVLLGLVAVVVVIILVIVRPGSGSSKSPGAQGPGASSSPSSSSSAVAPKACAASKVTLLAVTDETTYAAGVKPMISMSITNSGKTACTFDVGTDAQDYTITSGTDKIWDSRDCQTGAAANVQTLQPGKSLTTTPFPWDRTRSATTTCSAARPTVGAGGASYHLAVTLGKAKALTTKQFILN